MSKIFTVLLLIVLAPFNSLFGQAPQTINFQGLLTDNNGVIVANGNYDLVIKVYNTDTGGSSLWSESHTVFVEDGIYNLTLGSISPISLPFDQQYWVGVSINAGAELLPRIKLTAVPYSFNTYGINDNTISTSKIQNNAITSEKIDANQVVKSLNGLKDNINLLPGANITIQTGGNDITISSTGGGGGIGGGGATNYLPIFTNSTTLGNSQIYQLSNNIGIGTLNPLYPFHVSSGNLITSYFTSNNLSDNTHILHSEYNGPSGNFHPIAVYGESIPNDGYGYGGWFESGFRGVMGRVHSNSTNECVGTYGWATGIGAARYGILGYTIVDGGSNNGVGVYGFAGGPGGPRFGIYGVAYGTGNYAGFFDGNVAVGGILSKGGGSFKIDHPLDPANKLLYHSFVESPDMMNIYNGNIVTDGAGYASVELPDWFEALNKDFRYQLTVIGDFAQAIISQKVQNNRFVISTDKPNIEVSWQVTGIRKDAFAEKNRIPVEEMKPENLRGKYLHPTSFNLPESEGMYYESSQPQALQNIEIE